MGDLITFSRASTPLRSAPPPSGETAEILFFTGVRYYRMPDAVEPQPVARRRKRSAAIEPDTETPYHA